MAFTTDEAANSIRQQLIVLNDMVAPFHEWLGGEVAYFVGQGFSASEARAMAACSYVTAFGSAISGVDRHVGFHPESDDG